MTSINYLLKKVGWEGMSYINVSLHDNSFDDLEEDHVYRCKNLVLSKVEKAKNLRHSARKCNEDVLT